jgi:hypothetical protein
MDHSEAVNQLKTVLAQLSLDVVDDPEDLLCELVSCSKDALDAINDMHLQLQNQIAFRSEVQELAEKIEPTIGQHIVDLDGCMAIKTKLKQALEKL